MKRGDGGNNVCCNVLNTLYERKVPYYCHKIEAPNVITPCMAEGKAYLLNNEVTASVMKELNGSKFPACFHALNGSEKRKRLGCQMVGTEIAPAAETVLAPHLAKLLCQLSGMNNHSDSCLWASPKKQGRLSSVELAILTGLLNAVRSNNGPAAECLANKLKLKVVEEILWQCMSRGCGRSPNCAKARLTEEILPEVENMLCKLRKPQAGVECMLTQIVSKVRSLNSPTLCAVQQVELASEILSLIDESLSRMRQPPAACDSRASHIICALTQLRGSMSRLLCHCDNHSTSSSSWNNPPSLPCCSGSGSRQQSGGSSPCPSVTGDDARSCKALGGLLSQLKELRLAINGPQLVGYVKSPKRLCEAIYSDLKSSPYLRAHLFRPRKKNLKPKHHYIHIQSSNPCNPDSFFLEFVL